MSNESHPEAAGAKVPLLQQLSSFSNIYWIANWMELVERFAYYGVRVVLPVFMVAAFQEGGPEFDHKQKGMLFAIWALVQSFVPIFTGGFADRYGYKINIAISTVLKIIGYLVMGYSIFMAESLAGMSLAEARPDGADWTYTIFFVGAMFLALGTAIFKPGLQGLIAHQMPKKFASVGWAMFYQMVNIGAFIGPMLAGYLRVLDWTYVFLACAAGIALNFFPLLLFKEPDHHGETNKEGVFRVLLNSVRGLLEPRLFFFTISFAGFWLMFYQLFDILPNFIDDWIDSRAVANALKESVGGTPLLFILGGVVFLVGGLIFLAKKANNRPMRNLTRSIWLGAIALPFAAHYLIQSLGGSSLALTIPTVHGGNLTQEWVINFNAFLISLFAFAMGYLTGKAKSLHAIIFGVLVSAGAIYALGLSMNGWWIIAMIGIFSFGEMTASPTKMRYLASIAPPGKEGLYMGYVNFTVGIGWSIGSIIAGELYQEGGDKVVLARRYLVDKAGQTQETIDNLSKAEVLPFFEQTLNVDAWGLRDMLWANYEPYAMWEIFTWIGLGSMIAIIIYNWVTSAASKNPSHSFNHKGYLFVRFALAPIAFAFWWVAWYKLTVQDKELKEVLAILVQAVMFSMLFLVSLSTKAGEKLPGQGEESTTPQ